MSKWDLSENNLDFLNEDLEETVEHYGTYKILIADDEEEIHRITKVILDGFVYEGMGLEFIDTYSAKDTMKVLSETSDIAILFLDVIMERDISGLEVVKYLRKELNNHMTRVVLRTGQPGEAPEEDIIREYDINDYRLKTELTVQRLMTTVYSSIRNYRDLMRLDKNQKGLEKIIKTSANLFENNSLEEFLTSILEALSSFHEVHTDVVYMRNEDITTSNGFVTMKGELNSKIMAATGKYKPYIGMSVESIPELNHVYKHLIKEETGAERDFVRRIDNGFIVSTSSISATNNYIFIEGKHEFFDFNLINLFLSNFSIALDNFVLNNMLTSTQKEIVYALAETVESHFQETGNHIKRISNMMYNFSLNLHFSYQEAEMLRLASTMHDLGKIAIPDNILKKPGRLTDEEFEVIKTHTNHGYKILAASDLPVLKMAAEIALNHHEKYDGSGYPGGKTGRNIPSIARMMAIVDVFDAMTHKRVYKEAISIEETLREMKKNMGSHFDPDLMKIFLENLENIITNIE